MRRNNGGRVDIRLLHDCLHLRLSEKIADPVDLNMMVCITAM